MHSVNRSIKSSGPRAVVCRAIACTRLSFFLGAMPGWVRYAFTRSQNSEVGRRKHMQAVGGTSSVVLALVAALRLPTKSSGRWQSRTLYFLYLPILSSRLPPFFLHRNQLTTLVRLNKLRQNER